MMTITKSPLKSLFQILCYLLVFNFALSSSTFANEKIIEFNSDIKINTDASADITERITVIAEQKEIRHGITRLLPLSYQTGGELHSTDYTINQIWNGDTISPYHTERYPDKLKIYVGSKNTLLATGSYTYTFVYHATNAVLYEPNQDEFYWNITGNSWSFPIEKIIANITLPNGAQILNEKSYTGFQNESGADATSERLSDNQLRFTSTRLFQPGEGLTIAVSWPKNIVTAPKPSPPTTPSVYQTSATNLQSINAWYSSKSTPICVFFIALIFLYYWAAWYYSRPEQTFHIAIPLFSPPAAMDPAAIRYISNLKFDDKIFTAAIISMATKNFICIEEAENGEYILRKITDDTRQLSAGEIKLSEELFKKDNALVLNYNYRNVIVTAKIALQKSLNTEYKSYIATHPLKLAVGFFLSSIAIFALFSPEYLNKIVYFILLFFTIKALSSGLKSLYSLFTSTDSFNIDSFFTLIVNLCKTFFTLLFTVIFVFLIHLDLLLPRNFILILVIILINYFAYRFSNSYTQLGSDTVNQIDGFKLYLETTEQDQLNRLNPPDKTPELFEKYLPYAIALDIENKWSENFSDILLDATHNETPYRPTWFLSGNWSGMTLSIFANTLNNGITNSVTSAMVAPGGSGGGFSVGGGGSGGGGGGGGGGGW
jgi:uncharacterized membrane protein YgcG